MLTPQTLSPMLTTHTRPGEHRNPRVGIVIVDVRCGIASQAPVPVARSAGRGDGCQRDGSWFGRAAPTGRPARWSAGPLGLTSEKTRGSGAGGILPLTRQRGRHSDRQAGRTERGSLRWSCPSWRAVSGREDRRPRLWRPLSILGHAGATKVPVRRRRVERRGQTGAQSRKPDWGGYIVR